MVTVTPWSSTLLREVLPEHPAIDRVAAMWTAQELVDHTGLYASRAQALRDLNTLRDLGTVTATGGRWRYIRPHEDIRR